MARTTGARNNDYEDKRAAMAAAVAMALVRAGAGRPSLRELARETGFSVNNLRHYFGDRDGLVTAAMAAIEAQGKQHTDRVRAMAATAPPEEVLPAVLHEIASSWDTFLGNMHVAGLAEGLGSQALGPSYVNHILEPTLQSFELLVQDYIGRGLLRGESARALALSLAAPVLMALLHQSSLFGARCRPLDVHAYIDSHVAGFMRAHGA